MYKPFGKDPWTYKGGLRETKKLEADKTKNEEFNKDWTMNHEKGNTSADYYFNSYEHHSIHEDMLKDEVRTGSYYNAIVKEPHLFKDKIVIDVGAGTGILSLFAAQAGAKKVISIECSRIIEMARQIAKDNKYDDTIEFVHAKAEESFDIIDEIGVSLGFEKGEKFADIIISEWMGYFLLYESMMDSVIDVRDRFLRPEGSIFPDKATLNVALLEDREYKHKSLNYWNNVYGFDYSCMQKFIYEEPTVDYVEQQAICSDICTILELDLLKCSKKDLEFVSEYELKFNRNDYAQALVTWFDIGFTCCHRPIVFSTGPFGCNTHWKQTTFYFKKDITGNEGDVVKGSLACRKNLNNPRDLDIKLHWKHDGKVDSTDTTQYYRIC